MKTSILSVANIEGVKNIEFAGVALLYSSLKKDNTTKTAATFFTGEDFAPKDTTQNEMFRVWRNVVTTFWRTKIKKAELKKDNNAINDKLRTGAPTEIWVRLKGGKSVRWDISGSVWKNIGLAPSKKDIEACTKERDIKRKIHSAAVASFDALNFRVKFEDEAVLSEKAETSDTKPTQPEVKADTKSEGAKSEIF